MGLKKLLNRVRSASKRESKPTNSKEEITQEKKTTKDDVTKDQVILTPKEETKISQSSSNQIETKQSEKTVAESSKEEIEDEVESSESEGVEETEEEENEEESDDFVGNLEFDARKKDSDFRALSPQQIVVEQEKEIQAVAELLQVPQSAASALLRHFQWKKERLIQRYFENPEQVRKEAGIGLDASGELIVHDTGKEEILTGEVCCSICGDDVPAKDATSLTCKHRFCNDCWKRYLTLKIKEGDVSKIKCPNKACTLAVDESKVKKLVDPEVYDRFIKFITRSFVEDSDGRVKWCPQPNCGHAITTDMVKGTIVKCICGHRFCFSCHREAHAPATCEQVKQWEMKCADDSETTHWKYANCKDCPKCETSTEKNGGCNHMTCLKCKHEWCWVCMKPWKGHNDYYNCNKFMKTEKKSFFSLRKGKKKDKAKEREEQRERNRIALERYLHYYERFVNHSHSRDLEKQIKDKAIAKMSELQKEATTSSEVQYVLEGTETLIECRNVLKYTYVCAYFLPESGPQKELFEYLQESLEKTTENLSETIETSGRSADRLKALNIIQLAQTQRNNLLTAVEQGLTEMEPNGQSTRN